MMWWLILPVALFVSLAVVAIVACLSGPKHPRHAAPRHLEAVPDLPDTLSYAPVMGAPPWPLADWREQTRAELSPEALGTLNGLPVYAPGVRGAWVSTPPEREFLTTIPGTRMTIYTGGEIEFTDPPDDSGPGGGAASSPDSPATPGPDWLIAQMADTFAWVRAMIPQVTGWSVAA